VLARFVDDFVRQVCSLFLHELAHGWLPGEVVHQLIDQAMHVRICDQVAHDVIREPVNGCAADERVDD